MNEQQADYDETERDVGGDHKQPWWHRINPAAAISTLLAAGFTFGAFVGYGVEEFRDTAVTVEESAPWLAKIAVPLNDKSDPSPVDLSISGVAGDFENADLFVAIQRGPGEYWIKERIEPNDSGQWMLTLEDALEFEFPGAHHVVIVQAEDDETEEELARRVRLGDKQVANDLPSRGILIHDSVKVICCLDK